MAGWSSTFNRVVYYDGSVTHDRSPLYTANPAMSASRGDTSNKAFVFPMQQGMFMSSIYIHIADRDI